MARALKVFRTSVGFHDAYVAAPSQKAALDAWGAGSNLFGTGLAEIVTDPRLTKEPLSKPGQVVKVVRGTAAQHLAALPRPKKKPAQGRAQGAADDREVAKPKARPSRRALDAAEKAVGLADEKYGRALKAIRDREDALHREKLALNERREMTLARLSRKLDDIRTNYERATNQWRS